MKAGKSVPVRNRYGRFAKSLASSANLQKRDMKPFPAPPKRKYKKRNVPVTPPRTGKKTSVVWHFFKSLPHENGVSRASCLLCKVAFKNPGGSTTGMRGHLERKHPGVLEQVADKVKKTVRQRVSCPAPKIELKRDPSSPPPPVTAHYSAIGAVGETDNFEDSGMLEQDGVNGGNVAHVLPGPPPEVYSTTDSNDIARSIVLYLASVMQPLCSLEESHFKKLLYTLNSTFMSEVANEEQDSILGPVTQSLNEVYEATKEDIKSDLQNQAISLSLDLWKKTNVELYILIKANYISREWNSETRFLGLKLLPGVNFTYTSPDVLQGKVSTELQSVLEEFGLKSENLASIVFNTSPPMEMASGICGNNAIPCFIKVIQKCYQIANTYMRELTGFDLLLEAEKVVEQFQSNYEDLKCNPGLLFQTAKNYLLCPPYEDFSFPASLDDFDACMKFQEPLNAMLEILFEQQEISTSSLLPLVFGIRRMLEKSLERTSNGNQSVGQRKMISEGLLQFIYSCYSINPDADDFNAPNLVLSTFFDPRYKGLEFFTKRQTNYVYDTVTELLHEIDKKKYNYGSGDTGAIVSVRSENPEYARMNGGILDPLSPATPSISSLEGWRADGPRTSSKLAEVISGVVGRKNVPVPSFKTLVELNNYRSDPEAKLSHDPLQWWSYNSHRFPTLAGLARIYLCTQLTATLPSHSFTAAGKQYYDNLARIEPEHVSQLHVIKNYYSEPPELEIASDRSETCDTARGQNPNDQQEMDEEGSVNIIKTEGISISLMDEEV